MAIYEKRAIFTKQASLLGLLLAGGPAIGQQVVTPTKVTAEVYLDQANDNFSRCGIHWANLVVQGGQILAYQINIEGWFFTESKQSTTVVWASLRTTTVNKAGQADQTSHIDTVPSDLYLFIQQDPTKYRITPEPDAFPANWFGGPIDAGGINGDEEKAFAPALALIKHIPMLVYLVFDSASGSKTTLAFTTENDLPTERDAALADCFLRAAKRVTR